MHLDKNEIFEMISSLALIETEASEARKRIEEQGPHAVKVRHMSILYIEKKAQTLKNDLISRIT